MSEIDWSKAPEGATHCLNEEGRRNIWRRRSPDNWSKWEAFVDGDWLEVAECRPENYAQRPPAWSGEGLPPVGEKCEVENEYLGGWDVVDSILAHAVVMGNQVAVFQIGNRIACAKAGSFRPIRTPEQIAAEEREMAVAAIVEVIREARFAQQDTDIAPAKMALAYAEHLYDNGYRKVDP